MKKIFSIALVAGIFTACGEGGNDVKSYEDTASTTPMMSDTSMSPGMMDTTNRSMDTSGNTTGSGTGSGTAPGTGSTGSGTGTNPVSGGSSSGTPVQRVDTSR
jgi:hypothetical protein